MNMWYVNVNNLSQLSDLLIQLLTLIVILSANIHTHIHTPFISHYKKTHINCCLNKSLKTIQLSDKYTANNISCYSTSSK